MKQNKIKMLNEVQPPTAHGLLRTRRHRLARSAHQLPHSIARRKNTGMKSNRSHSELEKGDS
jgi:hypothetical protein